MADSAGDLALNYVHSNILTEGEEIVWKGRPDPKETLKVGWIATAFGVPFLAFSIFWMVMASEAGWFALFGIPFVLIGLFLVSRPIRQYLKAGKVYYAITNKRVLILEAGKTFKTTSIRGNEITDYEREDKIDGTGNIQLRKTITHNDRGSSSSVEFNDGLWGIADIKGAAEAITKLRSAPPLDAAS